MRYASKELQNDREIVLIAVTQNGYVLKYASKELQNDREIVLDAVTQNGRALKYASKELQNDREIVLTAIQHNYEDQIADMLFTDLMFLKQYMYLRDTDITIKARHIFKIITSDIIFERVLLLIFKNL